MELQGLLRRFCVRLRFYVFTATLQQCHVQILRRLPPHDALSPLKSQLGIVTLLFYGSNVSKFSPTHIDMLQYLLTSRKSKIIITIHLLHW